MTKFNTSNCDKTQEHKLWQKKLIVIKRTISDKSILLRTTWYLDNRWDVFEAALLRSCNNFLIKKKYNLVSFLVFENWTAKLNDLHVCDFIIANV